MKTQYKETCKGCNILIIKCTGRALGHYQCAFVDFDLLHECPCVECLVKMICTKQCKERMKKRDEAISKGIREDERMSLPHIMLDEDYNY
jgi:hypothetical protein